MNEEYQKGEQIGEIRADIKNLASLLETHNQAQLKWNSNMEKEVEILKAWVQTTTGKVVILTAVFSIVGTGVYMLVSWFLSRYK